MRDLQKVSARFYLIYFVLCLNVYTLRSYKRFSDVHQYQMSWVSVEWFINKSVHIQLDKWDHVSADLVLYLKKQIHKIGLISGINIVDGF